MRRRGSAHLQTGGVTTQEAARAGRSPPSQAPGSRPQLSVVLDPGQEQVGAGCSGGRGQGRVGVTLRARRSVAACSHPHRVRRPPGPREAARAQRGSQA